MNKKIYFLLLHLNIGGIEICMTNVANSLAKHGYDVTLVSVLKDNKLNDRINSNIKIVYLTSFKSGSLSLYYRLWRKMAIPYSLIKYIKKIENSIIVSTRNEFNIILSKYASENNLRIAQLHHDYKCNNRMIKDFKKHYNNIDYFFLLTDDVRNEIENIMQKNNTHTKCVTVPNFYPNEDLPVLHKRHRKNYAIAVGRLAPEKGFLRLLDTWDLVVHQLGKDCMLYIIGDGIQRPELEKKISLLKLENNVKLLGTLPNSKVRELMLEAKVYCMSSFTEAFPLVLLESLNNGLPQVAFDVRVGPRNIIVDKSTGFLINDGDLETYALKIIELFRNETMWNSMSAYSYKHASLFSENTVINKWIHLFNSKK